jgi:hypothetical protein
MTLTDALPAVSDWTFEAVLAALLVIVAECDRRGEDEVPGSLAWHGLAGDLFGAVRNAADEVIGGDTETAINRLIGMADQEYTENILRTIRP